jgi:hypothetical protein
MVMHREKRGRNYALVYSSRKKGGHLRTIYMIGGKRKDLHEMIGGRSIYFEDYNSLM